MRPQQRRGGKGRRGDLTVAISMLPYVHSQETGKLILDDKDDSKREWKAP